MNIFEKIRFALLLSTLFPALSSAQGTPDINVESLFSTTSTQACSCECWYQPPPDFPGDKPKAKIQLLTPEGYATWVIEENILAEHCNRLTGSSCRERKVPGRIGEFARCGWGYVSYTGDLTAAVDILTGTSAGLTSSEPGRFDSSAGALSSPSAGVVPLP